MESYLVFARTEYDEPVKYRGEVEASGDEEARKAALDRYGDKWLELVLVPQREIYWVQREKEEVGA